MNKPALSKLDYDLLMKFLGADVELPNADYFVGVERIGGQENYFIFDFPLTKGSKKDGEIIGPEEFAKDEGFPTWFLFRGKSFMPIFYQTGSDDNWFDGNKYSLGQLLVEFLGDYTRAVADHARKSYWRNTVEVMKYRLATLWKSIKVRF